MKAEAFNIMVIINAVQALPEINPDKQRVP
jgi:hypothetical protein